MSIKIANIAVLETIYDKVSLQAVCRWLCNPDESVILYRCNRKALRQDSKTNLLLNKVRISDYSVCL